MLRLISLFFLILFVNYSAQDIKVLASTDTSDYLVGDYINFTIEVEHDEKIRISPPSLTDKLGSLEVIQVLPVTFDKEKNIQRFNYIISGYDSARVVIPEIPISYFSDNISEAKTANSNQVVVFIHTLDVNPTADIKDIKKPLSIPFDWKFWSIIILVIITILLIAYLLYKKFKKPVDETRVIKKVPALPIHIIALKALDKLDNKKLWQQGQIKDYHSEITEIIRRYFEERYHFNSLEMTTAESMLILDRAMDNQNIIDITGRFLTNADMVKFAKFEPLPSVNEEMLKQAYEIVERTKLFDDLQEGAKSVQ